MNKTLNYLFDPLCGWCYGVMPAVSELLEIPAITIELLPTGLFSGEGARSTDAGFATFAWSNDQRIERLTGQRFTERYRQRVLGDRKQLLDSGLATVALTAVWMTAPSKELAALKAVQRARYVDGTDVTSSAMLVGLLEALDLKDAAARLAHPDADLLGANRARIGRAEALMQEFGARGVPALIVKSGAQGRVLDHAAAYSNPHALISQLQAA